MSLKNKQKDAINIGIIGFGNVGQGVFDILAKNQLAIEGRLGKPLVIRRIVVRNVARYQDLNIGDAILSDQVSDILEDPNIQIVAEAMGGEYPAYDFITKALENKKFVVTANKEVIAKHKVHFFDLAKKNGVDIYFEAAVGGGIPIIRLFKVGYAANQITGLYGILNGTTNYILTKMYEENMEFSVALKQAQEAGFAEADPTADISGLDSAYKLVILTFVAFKLNVSIDKISYTGIESVSLKDLQVAAKLGYRIRLIAMAKLIDENMMLAVRPMLIKEDHPLAQVRNEFNAIFSVGNAKGESMAYGKGAGALPTGSAVISDLVDIAFDIQPGNEQNISRRNLERVVGDATLIEAQEMRSSYFLRVHTKNEPGVLEQVVRIFSEASINLDKVIQTEASDEGAEIVLITQEMPHLKKEACITQLSSLDTVTEVVSVFALL